REEFCSGTGEGVRRGRMRAGDHHSAVDGQRTDGRRAGSLRGQPHDLAATDGGRDDSAAGGSGSETGSSNGECRASQTTAANREAGRAWAIGKRSRPGTESTADGGGGACG